MWGGGGTLTSGYYEFAAVSIVAFALAVGLIIYGATVVASDRRSLRRGEIGTRPARVASLQCPDDSSGATVRDDRRSADALVVWVGTRRL